MLFIVAMAGIAVLYYLSFENQKRNLLGCRRASFDHRGRLLLTYNGDVYRINLNTGNLELLIETEIKTEFSEIMDIAVSPRGKIYLSDPHSHKILTYSARGEFVRSYPGLFQDNGKIVADDKRVYVADMQGNRVIALDATAGELLWESSGYLTPDDLFLHDLTVYISDVDDSNVRLLFPEMVTRVDTSAGVVTYEEEVTIKKGSFDASCNYDVLITKLDAITGTHEDAFPVKSDIFDSFHGNTILVTNEGNILLSPMYHDEKPLLLYSSKGEFLNAYEGPDGYIPGDIAISTKNEIILVDEHNFALYSIENDQLKVLDFPELDKLYGELPQQRVVAIFWSEFLYHYIIFLVVALIMLLAINRFVK